MKRPRSPTDGERDGDTSTMTEGTDDEEEDDDDEDEDAPFLTKTAKYMKEVMYKDAQCLLQQRLFLAIFHQ